MKAHLAYLNYVLRHKWFVFLACLRLQVPLWPAIIHDWTKFLPIEWNPYVRAFYHPDGTPRQRRDSSGAYDPAKVSSDFDRAWLHHQRNPHHWQAWVLVGSSGVLKPLPMPEPYIREMIADWIGAGQAQGQSNPQSWYQKNGSSMILHPETRTRVESLLQELTY